MKKRNDKRDLKSRMDVVKHNDALTTVKHVGTGEAIIELDGIDMTTNILRLLLHLKYPQ